MRVKWFTIGLTLAALAASIFGLRFVPQQFFPASDRPELLVDLKLSEASSLYATEKVVTAFEQLLKGDPEIDHWTTYAGQGAVRFICRSMSSSPTIFLPSRSSSPRALKRASGSAVASSLF